MTVGISMDQHLTSTEDTATAVGRSVRVLVVEDNADQRMLMERSLASPIITVMSVGSGQEALHLLPHVDLVLIDHGLPDMTGIDLLGHVQNLANGPSAVLVTSNESTATVVEALRHGAVDYVRKEHGFLTTLPDVVMRAWRQHDLARRTRELQRLALLVHRAGNVEGVADEIVTGAQRLLDAGECLLVVEEDGSWQVQASIGASAASDPLLARLADIVPPPGGLEVVDRRNIVVALAHRFADQRGALLLVDVNAPVHEELELAQTFAAFAATALDNVRRRDTERALIAQLRATVEARRGFVASVSHELRTPLTSINGYAETLMTRWGELDETVRRQCLTRIRRNGAELSRLVEQLIDIASFERGHAFSATLRSEPLLAHVHDIIDNLGSVLEGRDIVVEGHPVHALVDKALFRRVLSNLVTNAVKYSPSDAPVRVRLERDGGHAILSVVDNGVGLGADEMAHIFEPFWRAPHAVENAIRGSGIGLALVRQYVAAMSGTLEVDSAPGRGSTFTVRLPAASHSAGTAQAPA